MANRELLGGWLKEAHAMEKSQPEAIERFHDDFKDYPDVQSKISEHLRVTERQIDDLKLCLNRLNMDTSTIKTATDSAIGIAQDVASGPFKDDVVKNLLIMHAHEHFEHARYISLATAAKECGEEDIADACDQICQEELEMADWLEEQIPVMAVAVIQKET